MARPRRCRACCAIRTRQHPWLTNRSPSPSRARRPSRRRAHGSEPEIQPEVAELQRERDDYYDRLLRKTAEFDNYRKRVERERREQADQAVADLLLGAAARRRRLRPRADGRGRR